MIVLTHVEVAVRVFNPAQGLESGEIYVLPLDNADAEHGCTFPLANAASLAAKMHSATVRSVAFCAVDVRESISSS